MASYSWFFYSLGAAVLWGASYAISEELLQKRGVPASFLMFTESLIAVVFFAFLSQYLGTFKEGLSIISGSHKTLALVFVMGLFFVVGNYFTLMGISEKNATLASFIEISYPIFTIIFVWLFMNKFDLNLYSTMGSALILSGLGLIFFKG